MKADRIILVATTGKMDLLFSKPINETFLAGQQIQITGAKNNGTANIIDVREFPTYYRVSTDFDLVSTVDSVSVTILTFGNNSARNPASVAQQYTSTSVTDIKAGDTRMRVNGLPPNVFEQGQTIYFRGDKTGGKANIWYIYKGVSGGLPIANIYLDVERDGNTVVMVSPDPINDYQTDYISDDLLDFPDENDDTGFGTDDNDVINPDPIVYDVQDENPPAQTWFTPSRLIGAAVISIILYFIFKKA